MRRTTCYNQGATKTPGSRPEFCKVCVVFSSSWLPSREIVFIVCVKGPLQARKGRQPLECGIPGGFLQGHRRYTNRHQSSGKGNFDFVQLWTSLQCRSIFIIGNRPEQGNLDFEQLDIIILREHRSSTTIQHLGHYSTDTAKGTDNVE